MKKILLILAIALLAGLLGLACSVFIAGPGALLRTTAGQWLFQEVFTPTQDQSHNRINIGEIVPAFSVLDFSGQSRALPKPGQWQVINYWASWCAPCRKEMPLLSAMNNQSAGRFAVIGIALDDKADAQAFLAETPIGFEPYQETPSPFDSSSRLGNDWGVLPYTVLIDPQGRLRRKHIGQFDSQPQLNDWLSEGMRSEN
jgi:thiol-disulfide isomerase/thioredoxin